MSAPADDLEGLVERLQAPIRIVGTTSEDACETGSCPPTPILIYDDLRLDAAAAIIRLRGEKDELRAALVNSRDTLVFMRVRGSLAIAAFVRGTSDRRERVVEMLDRLDDTIAAVCTALKEPNE